MTDPKAEVTSLLRASESREEAVEQILPIVLGELRRIASTYLRKRPSSLQTTELVNEAYLKLVDAEQLPWKDRRHFYACAALATRQILVDLARRQQAGKRIPEGDLIPLSSAQIATPGLDETDLLALDQALSNLAETSPEHAQIVELRYFGGLTEHEVAEVMGVSRAKVARSWKSARIWLRRLLGGKTE